MLGVYRNNFRQEKKQIKIVDIDLKFPRMHSISIFHGSRSIAFPRFFRVCRTHKRKQNRNIYTNERDNHDHELFANFGLSPIDPNFY